MIKNKKYILLGFVIIALFIIEGVLVFYFTKRLISPAKKEVVTQSSILPDSMKAGEVGEIPEGKTLADVNPEAIKNPVRSLDTPMPPIVSDTKGKIISIGENTILVMGSGENFADQKPRELTVKFTQATITFEKGQSVRYNGLEGLKHLEIGQTILISSSENIRGKTEFTASYINKI